MAKDATRTRTVPETPPEEVAAPPKTQPAHVVRLRQKLDQNRPTKLIHTIRGVGYRLGAVE